MIVKTKKEELQDTLPKKILLKSFRLFGKKFVIQIQRKYESCKMFYEKIAVHNIN